MTLNARTISIAVFAAFLMSACGLYAAEAAMPSGAGKAMDSGSADPIASLFSIPAQHSSMAAAMPHSGGHGWGIPRFDLFVGYSYIRAVPSYTVDNRLVWLHGGSTSLAYNVNRRLGLVGDFGAYTNSEMRFSGGYTGTVDVDNSNVAVMTYLFGPRLSFWKQDRVSLFAQALFGGVHANEVVLKNCTVNCTLLPSENSFAMTAGGGLDLRVRPHFAIRLFQAEYLMTRFTNFTTGVSGTQNDIRLSSGIVFRFGGRGSPLLAAEPLAYSCSVNPVSVFAGDPIAVSGTAVNLDPVRTAVYTWSADGGRVSGASDTASIDTKDVLPGAYTLKGHVSQGDKAQDNADCSAPYAVKAYEPPSVTCTANPATVVSGDPSTITAVGVSPQEWPLTYSYSANSGSINGSGATAVLSTGGVEAGTIDVTCSVADGKGQGASAKTTVTVVAPVAAPKPSTQQLCSIGFTRDARRPSRVDNEAKACLDEVALSLQRNPNANLAVVGNAASSEKDGKKLAADRAVNTREYLVSEKGIDASRIAVYIGSQDDQTVSTTLVPAEATLDTTGITRAD
jgi:outer membrane protein OmpA-like peptidoglycan-associated protein